MTPKIMFAPSKRLTAWVIKFAAGIGAVCFLVAPNAFANCETIRYEKREYIVCSYKSGEQDLRFFWKNEQGQAFGSFPALSHALAQRNEELVFAMNAGVFHSDYSPVGLYIENGRELKPAITGDGEGNFYLKPNGVFLLHGGVPQILETSRFVETKPSADFATQSGPLLLENGKLHPKFAAPSKEPTFKIRNGVGVTEQKTMHFAISNTPVSFREFMLFFKDRLKCKDALFLNGSTSSLHLPALNRTDRWLPIGPVVGVVRKTKPGGKPSR